MKVAIIGAGAAGLMAAATIIEESSTHKVTVFEKNGIIGHKVMISGGGRCNVTTGIRDIKKLLDYYPRGKRFLRYGFHEFGPTEVYNWFEAHGVPLKTESDLRVFPKSNIGKDIVAVFEKLFKKHNVDLKKTQNIIKISKNVAGFLLETANEKFTFDKIVIATGGQAYRHTGSTGDGYSFAENLGHSITKLAPSLNSFISVEKWPADIAGTSFQDAIVSCDRNSKFHYRGPFLFTHKGVSGPAAFALSSMIAFEEYHKSKPLNLFLDLFPHQNFEELRERLKKLLEGNKKALSKILPNLKLTKRSAAKFLEILNINPEKFGPEVNKKDINNICNFLKKIPLTIIGRGAGDEFVTAGGVNLKEVDQKTMESKTCPGAYFVGELLDVDGFTGGFNLSASWASGFVAGRSIVAK